MHERTEEQGKFGLPFSYCLERDDDELISRRADGFVVATFGAGSLGVFEVELMVWEDAD